MFGYLDRFYIKNLGANGQTLTETALELWSKTIFEELISELQSSVNEEIRKDRMDETVDLDDVRLGIQQFLNQGIKNPVVIKDVDGEFLIKGEKNLKTYTDCFEKYLLEQTKKFYKE